MSHSDLSALVAIEWSPACYDGHLVRPLSVMAALSSSRSTQTDILYRELSALCPVILLTIVIVTLSARVFILLTHQDYHEKIDQDLGHSLMIPTWSRQAAHSLQWVLQSSGQGEIAETVPDGQRVDNFWLSSSSSLRWPEICPRGQLMPPRTRWVSDCDHLAPGWLVSMFPPPEQCENTEKAVWVSCSFLARQVGYWGRKWALLVVGGAPDEGGEEGRGDNRV